LTFSQDLNFQIKAKTGNARTSIVTYFADPSWPIQCLLFKVWCHCLNYKQMIRQALGVIKTGCCLGSASWWGLGQAEEAIKAKARSRPGDAKVKENTHTYCLCPRGHNTAMWDRHYYLRHCGLQSKTNWIIWRLFTVVRETINILPFAAVMQNTQSPIKF
jgi:hypothetical protein